MQDWSWGFSEYPGALAVVEPHTRMDCVHLSVAQSVALAVPLLPGGHSCDQCLSPRLDALPCHVCAADCAVCDRGRRQRADGFGPPRSLDPVDDPLHDREPCAARRLL